MYKAVVFDFGNVLCGLDRMAFADGYFGTASAMSTILLVVTGISTFIVNRYFSRGNETFIAS